MARASKSYEIFTGIIVLVTPPLNVMDLEILYSPARLATPAISPQDFTAELEILFRVKLSRGRLARICVKASPALFPTADSSPALEDQ